jgi:hypothetical protein
MARGTRLLSLVVTLLAIHGAALGDDMTAPTKITTDDACADKAGALGKAAANVIIDATATPIATYFYVGDLDPIVSAACKTATPTSVATFARDSSARDRRWISRKGDLLFIYLILGEDHTMTVTVTEEYRDTRLKQDVVKLAQMIKEASGLKGFGGKPAVSILVGTYALTRERATVTVTYALDKDKAATAATIITGAAEHLSLSAVLPVNTLKTLTFDTAGSQVVTKDAQREFLIGLDYHFGDVWRSATWRPSIDAWVVSAVGKFSKSPLDTVGAVGGWRLPVATLFIGPTWSREAASDATASNQRKVYRYHTRYGVSFDLKIAAGWLADLKKKDQSTSSGKSTGQ